MSAGQHPQWLQDAIEHDMGFADMKLRTIGETPTIVTIRGRERWMIIQLIFRDTEEKLLAYRTVRVIAHAEQAEALTMLSEVWARQVTRRDREGDDEFDRRSRAIPPSEAEDRIDAISCHVVYRDTASEVASDAQLRPIRRDKKGAYLGLGEPLIEGEVGVMDSLLADCLPPADFTVTDDFKRFVDELLKEADGMIQVIPRPRRH